MTSRDRLFRDPVAFFLALAVADNAIKGVTTVEQLLKIRPQGGNKTFQFQWNEGKGDLPVFRTVTAKGPTSSSWNTSSMYHYLTCVSNAAGYKKGSITIHTLRRGLAYVVDGKNLCLAFASPSADVPYQQKLRRLPSAISSSGGRPRTPSGAITYRRCHLSTGRLLS